MLASDKDHGLNEHDYPLWQKRWKRLLGGAVGSQDTTQINLFGPANKLSRKERKQRADNVTVSTAWDWPTKEQFQNTDLIVAFSVIKWNNEYVGDLEKFLNNGGGFVTIHMSCVVPDGAGVEEEVAELIGLDWNWKFSRWRHGPMNLDIQSKNHPIILGLPQKIFFYDEAYWPLHGDINKVTVIGTSKETIGEIKIKDDQGKFKFDEISAIQHKWPKEPTKDEPMFWTHEYGKGRAYGCILGHYTWTFDDPYFRLLLLRGMAWAAGESPYRFDPLVLTGATVK